MIKFGSSEFLQLYFYIIYTYTVFSYKILLNRACQVVVQEILSQKYLPAYQKDTENKNCQFRDVPEVRDGGL